MALPEARFGGLSSFLSTTPCLSSQRSYSLCGYGLATTTAKWKLAQGCQRVGHAVESRDTRAGQMTSCAMKRNNLLRCVGGAMRASSSTGACCKLQTLPGDCIARKRRKWTRDSTATSSLMCSRAGVTHRRASGGRVFHRKFPGNEGTDVPSEKPCESRDAAIATWSNEERGFMSIWRDVNVRLVLVR